MIDRVPFGTVPVRISAKSMRQLFHGCEPKYIRDVCHGACCRSSTAPGGTLIRVAAYERPTIEAMGAIVAAGMIQPVDHQCPFQNRDNHLCELHGTDAKPFGCIASPFILTAPRHGYPCLVVRNRYRLLKCYGKGKPAYVAFRASLNLLFGYHTAHLISKAMEAGDGDLVASMPRRSFETLRELEGKR